LHNQIALKGCTIQDLTPSSDPVFPQDLTPSSRPRLPQPLELGNETKKADKKLPPKQKYQQASESKNRLN